MRGKPRTVQRACFIEGPARWPHIELPCQPFRRCGKVSVFHGAKLRHLVHQAHRLCKQRGLRRISLEAIDEVLQAEIKRFAARGEIRVIDESGEDYLYSADRFIAIDVPKNLELAILRAS